ncbi:MAG TPA: hypothetical protein PK168_00465 [Candidatus Paceibacterota bacterium]|jgi:hypothetical protein|nr:hypothetical protein [Parcubacteria group bacterium]HOM33066.1 hypothetical protein [Candidatus Paceibacterota bacterium]
MKNKYFIFTIIIFMGLIAFNFNKVVTAQQSNNLLIIPPDSSQTTSTPTILPTPEIIPPNIKNINIDDLKQSLVINEIKGRYICQNIGGCPNIDKKGETEITIKSAIITGISNDSLNIKIFDINYDVDLTDAKILRSQWIGTDLNNFSNGDIVNVYGFLDENNFHLIHAQTVRNMSLYKNLVIFNGIISNPINNTFILKTEKNDDINVIVNNDTKIIKVESAACIMIYPPVDCPKSIAHLISFNDLKNDDRAIVRGNWENNSNHFIAEQIIVGNDGREFFNKKLDIQNNVKNQESLREQIKNQIKNLEEQIKKLREQTKIQSSH